MYKIVFMGTPDFAVPTLQALINKTKSSKYKIVAAYTKPPKKSGRNLNITLSPIHHLALEHNIAVYTPNTLKEDSIVNELRDLEPDIIIVVAYGIILPKTVLEIPKYGCINLHPSALPRWRGAAPLEHTIMAGDKNTDICIMKMDEGMDTGPVILRQSIEIDDRINSLELRQKTSQIGALMMCNVLDAVIDNSAHYEVQNHEGMTLASKLTAKDEQIDWNQQTHVIHNQIRALSPKPGAYFIDNNQVIKILQADYILETDQLDANDMISNEKRFNNSNHNKDNGILESDDTINDNIKNAGRIIKITSDELVKFQVDFTKYSKKQIAIACGDGGFILPQIVQKYNGKVMTIVEFLNGYKFQDSDILS